MLRVLLVGDSEEVAAQLLEELAGADGPVEHDVVTTPAALGTALDGRVWDVILVDGPSRERGAAVTRELERRMRSLAPVLIVAQSATEDALVEAVAAGAFDLVSRGDATRLRVSLQHARQHAALREERSAAEERLRATEQLFRSVLNGAPMSIFATDERGVFTLHEGSVLELLDMEPGENVGKSAYDLFAEFPFRESGGASTTGRQVVSRVLAGETVTGETVLGERMFDNVIGPLRGSDGRVAGLVGVAFDITERKRFEDQLERSREELRAMARRLSDIDEEERRRIARELHDTVSQSCTAVGLDLAWVRDSLPAGTPASVLERLEETGHVVEDISRRLREVMADLRPPMLDDQGLVATLRWMADVHGRRGVEMRVEGERLRPAIPRAVATALVRIVQEALSNVTKHAQARGVTISVGERRGVVTVTVRDDGVGFDPSSEGAGRWGITIMRERAVSVGGELSVDSRPGAGTTVTATWRRPDGHLAGTDR